jgi:hypothetical protein
MVSALMVNNDVQGRAICATEPGEEWIVNDWVTESQPSRGLSIEHASRNT